MGGGGGAPGCRDASKPSTASFSLPELGMGLLALGGGSAALGTGGGVARVTSNGRVCRSVPLIASAYTKKKTVGVCVIEACVVGVLIYFCVIGACAIGVCVLGGCVLGGGVKKTVGVCD